MKSTRARILEYLESHQVATAAELAVALQMSAANVRYHLAILVETGQIEPYEERRPSGRGRPGRQFRLSGRAQNLDRLSGVLLEELLESNPPNDRTAVLRRLAERLLEPSNAIDPSTSSGLARRLTAAVQRLDENHYAARWEAHADGPRIILGHCPYYEIIDAHPELCQLDAAILENLLQQPVRQTAKLAPSEHGLPACIFLVTAGEHL